ncbi:MULTISPECIES: hypothetical protein [unclassified Breznakia]|uniref:hypothetical protein n=1 Tax=unclassified Breznakia TaxID=2623764 RepID=UPI0024765EC1|nr:MULTISPECIES: hypothetical protein [unclassified Breznakia]MDH6367903.1 hypothetical protein [Breznakia sp. PH1-1]MDH6404991.1 hypothetical protein [Breznakia sp. PF1-11]MDH6412698.1 hypothetical protein [Breznakia sp. PFB1-11]MDH6415066.1 hypothetical protein [Breznakia sp. PFB1-14]MDH6417377.1 hypothetical protein [Breznakia sp. PFB1-4]
MYNYFICLIFPVFFVVFLQFFGAAVSKNIKSYHSNFIKGFILYTFINACFGIPLQIVNGKWIYYFIFEILLLLSILVFIIISIRKKRIDLSTISFKEYVSNNIVLFIGAIIIVFFTLQFPEMLWKLNNTDDGYYLSKIASLPYEKTPFSTNPETGLLITEPFSYKLNTYELESSFFVYLFNVSSVVYARISMNFLNAYAMLNAIYIFGKKIVSEKYKNIALQVLSIGAYFLCLICIVKFINDAGEAWRFSTATHFGSTFVMGAGPVLLFGLFLDMKEITISKVVSFFIISVALISKSSIAVPIIFVAGIGGLISFLLTSNSNWKIRYGAILITIIAIVGTSFILPYDPILSKTMVKSLVANKSNLILYLTIIIILVYAIKKREIAVKRIVIIFSITLFLLVTPTVNSVIALFTQYEFALERMILASYGCLMLTAYFILMYLVVSLSKKELQRIALSSLVCAISILTTANLYYLTPQKMRRTAGLWYGNKQFVHKSTVHLANQVEDYYEKTGRKLAIVLPAGLTFGDYAHFPSSILRAFAPNCISLTATLRIEMEYKNKQSIYKGYNIDDQQLFMRVGPEMIEDELTEIQTLLNKYPINCIVKVSSNIEADKPVFEKLGFNKVIKVDDVYTMYINESFSIDDVKIDVVNK